MKKVIFLLVFTVTTVLFAQSKEYVAIIQAVYGKSKAELVKKYLNLDEVQKIAFQPIYDKYESERRILGHKKIQIINNYAANYAKLGDVKAAELTQANLEK